jgi:hypothetical protein
MCVYHKILKKRTLKTKEYFTIVYVSNVVLRALVYHTVYE